MDNFTASDDAASNGSKVSFKIIFSFIVFGFIIYFVKNQKKTAESEQEVIKELKNQQD